MLRAHLGAVVIVSVAACSDRSAKLTDTDEGSTSTADEATGEGTDADSSATSESETETSESETSESETSETGDNELVLDPDTLEFFELPIGSVRYAVAGQDMDSDTCVTLVWWGSEDPICAQPDMQGWPYVVITPNVQAPCTQWDYGGNVTLADAQGCANFTYGPDFSFTAEIDVSLEVSGDVFTGTIIASNI
jgi:hypothetical protein